MPHAGGGGGLKAPMQTWEWSPRPFIHMGGAKAPLPLSGASVAHLTKAGGRRASGRVQATQEQMDMHIMNTSLEVTAPQPTAQGDVHES